MHTRYSYAWWTASLVMLCCFLWLVSVQRPTDAATTTITTVKASLVEYAITLDRTSVPAGDVDIVVTNNGKMPHSLTVMGRGVNASLPQELQPGQTATLRITGIKPGRYAVYCPVDNHAQRGMRAMLTVTAK